LPEALNQRAFFLERPHDLAKRDRLRRPRQAEPAADAALGGDEAAVPEVAHDLGEMIAGDPELFGDLAGRERPLGLAGEPHQRAKGEIRERRQAHGSLTQMGLCGPCIAG
jgi:hypothetical protein